jgi:hypothetical protein
VYINDPHISSEIVDGQTVLIPTAEGWRRLQEQQDIEGLNLGSPDTVQWIWGRLEFVQQYPEFTLSLYRPGPGVQAWLGLVLLETETGWQRVHIERLTCVVCGWAGKTANPLLNDLYVGVPDKSAALEAANRHPVLPCPRCKSKLPRHPIWVEPLL